MLLSGSATLLCIWEGFDGRFTFVVADMPTGGLFFYNEQGINKVDRSRGLGDVSRSPRTAHPDYEHAGGGRCGVTVTYVSIDPPPVAYTHLMLPTNSGVLSRD